MGLSMSEVAENNPATAGSLLRGAREAAGIHIEALAVALKVPVSKLEALEADKYEALLDTVFVRALASSVCRTLKLDPVQVLSLLPPLYPVPVSACSPLMRPPRRATDYRGHVEMLLQLKLALVWHLGPNPARSEPVQPAPVPHRPFEEEAKRRFRHLSAMPVQRKNLIATLIRRKTEKKTKTFQHVP